MMRVTIRDRDNNELYTAAFADILDLSKYVDGVMQMDDQAVHFLIEDEMRPTKQRERCRS